MPLTSYDRLSLDPPVKVFIARIIDLDKDANTGTVSGVSAEAPEAPIHFHCKDRSDTSRGHREYFEGQYVWVVKTGIPATYTIISPTDYLTECRIPCMTLYCGDACLLWDMDTNNYLVGTHNGELITYPCDYYAIRSQLAEDSGTETANLKYTGFNTPNENYTGIGDDYMMPPDNTSFFHHNMIDEGTHAHPYCPENEYGPALQSKRIGGTVWDDAIGPGPVAEIFTPTTGGLSSPLSYEYLPGGNVEHGDFRTRIVTKKHSWWDESSSSRFRNYEIVHPAGPVLSLETYCTTKLSTPFPPTRYIDFQSRWFYDGYSTRDFVCNIFVWAGCLTDYADVPFDDGGIEPCKSFIFGYRNGGYHTSGTYGGNWGHERFAKCNPLPRQVHVRASSEAYTDKSGMSVNPFTMPRNTALEDAITAMVTQSDSNYVNLSFDYFKST